MQKRKKIRGSSLPTLRGSKQFKKYKSLTRPKVKKTRLKYSTHKFKIVRRGRKLDIEPEQDRFSVGGWVKIRVFVHTEGTPSKMFFPFVYGYKPRGWNWTHSIYEIHAVIRYDGTGKKTPYPIYKKISHKHYRLSGYIASGSSASSLSKALDQTLNKKLDSWREAEYKKAEAWYIAKGNEINTFKFKILALRCYRIGSSEKKEPAMIATLMKANIRNYISKEKAVYNKRIKKENADEQLFLQIGED